MHELRIAENLIRLRHERKITQEELAVRLGLASKHHMPRWENDEAFFDKTRRYGVRKG